MVIIPFDYITNILEISLMITVSEYINNNTRNQHVFCIANCNRKLLTFLCSNEMFVCHL